ncbi:MAG: OB-fold domain-containing protein [Candidatus Bathyarchaeia archaeon]|nr:MAG: hypothetical protein DRO27_02460 [Candidatus Bathyarchaeota archaeon]
MSEYLVSKFWEGVNNEELNGCECTSCGKLMLPARIICPSCGSRDLTDKGYKGTGTVKTKTKIHVPLPRFQSISPHGVGIIDLDEGVSISGLLLDDPEIGDRVKAVYLEDGEKKLLAFKPT